MGNPTPWAAHKGFGRNAYNPRYNERLEAQWQIRNQWKDPAIEKPVKVDFTFLMPIPSSASKKLREEILKGKTWHVKKPDATNLQKFMEDVIKGIVIIDDSQVVEISSRKKYSETPMTEIRIEVLS
jgi:Holliday junction resolvase RusA-like endonuclease